MKATTTFAIVMFAVIAYAAALPARKSMVYLQQPAAQWYSGPQRLMYMQYVQPSSGSQTHARSTQAAEVLVAGDSVATGTYLKDCDHEESDVAAAGPSIDASAAENVEVPSSVNALEVDVEDAAATTADEVNNVQEEVLSVAEAYPEEPAVEVEVEATGAPVEVESNDDDAKAPRELNFDNAEAPETPVYTDASAFPEPEAEPQPQPEAVPVPESVPEPAQEPEAAAAPAPEQPAAEAAAAIDVGGAAVVATRRYTPANKKVFVELEQPAAADLEEDDGEVAVDDDNETPVEDDDTVAVEDEEEDRIVVPVKPARRPAKKPLRPSKAAQPAAKPTATKKAPLPAGTFFPINFGGTSGGAIAIANSFSTGEGGSATSHAIAYGSPDAARAAHSRGTKKH